MRVLACALALSVASVAAFAETPAGPTAEVRQACKADVETLCKGIEPGGGRIAACLREKKDQVSAGCKTAIGAMMKARQSNAGASSSSGSTTPTTPAN
jgi:hypothetical protein